MKNCLMAFGAHADDIELQAGGTMAKYRRLGYETVYVMVTNNAAGCIRERDRRGQVISGFYPPARTMALRRKEALAAAKVIGASRVVFLDYKQGELWDAERKQHEYLDFTNYKTSEFPPGKAPIVVASRVSSCVKEVADLIVKFEPRIILTHSMDDENPEHGATCILVFKAVREAMKKVKLGVMLCWEPGTSSRIMGTGLDTYIDITDFFEKKKKALFKHKSQMIGCEWRWEYARAKAIFRGKEMDFSGKVKYAEAFRTVLNAFVLG